MKFGRRSLIPCLVILTLVFGPDLLAQQDAPPAELLAYADMVLFNGKVLTVDEKFTIADAVAVRDGKFLAVGSNDRILKLAGPRTRKIDLRGKTVAPGFIDSHQHLHSYAMRGVELRPRVRFGAESSESGLSKIKEIVERTPAGEWVIVQAVAPENAPSVEKLTRKELDQVAPSHPLAINLGHSDYVVNSYGLRVAKIPADTPGLIKDPTTGEPTGQLKTWAGGVMDFEVLPWIPLERLMPPLKAEMQRENAAGLTTVCTRVPGNYITALKEIWSRGELTMRWRVNHEFLRGNPQAEAYLKRVGNLNGFGDDWLKISGIFVSPVSPAFATGTELSWEQKHWVPDNVKALGVDLNGENRWEDERSERRNAVLAIRYGWNILGMHSAGSKDNSVVLETYEEALGQKPVVENKGRVLALDHGPMLSEKYKHITKMKALGVMPSIGMKYIFVGGERTDDAVKMYGKDRVDQMSPLKSLIDVGLKPVLEADLGEAPYFRPLWQMEKAITRKDDAGRVWGAHEAVTREQALRMYTSWAARYIGDENRLGSIEPGKLADLAVIDGDFLAVPQDQISDLPVVLTMVGGKVVFEGKGKAE